MLIEKKIDYKYKNKYPDYIDALNPSQLYDTDAIHAHIIYMITVYKKLDIGYSQYGKNMTTKFNLRQ